MSPKAKVTCSAAECSPFAIRLQVSDITTDLCDGVLLTQMVYGLLRGAGRTFQEQRYNKRPKLKQHKLENLGIILKVLAEQNVKLVNIGEQRRLDFINSMWKFKRM